MFSNRDQSKHVNCFILELAAIVFLAITAPFWFPIAVLLFGYALVIALGLGVVAVVIFGFIYFTSNAKAEEMLLLNDCISFIAS